MSRLYKTSEVLSGHTHSYSQANCAVLPGHLLASEHFGYDAVPALGPCEHKDEKFELCHGGTVLLDEIAEMSANLQAKVLHVLQE